MHFNSVLLKVFLTSFLLTITNMLFAQGETEFVNNRPVLGMQEIRASHVIHNVPGGLPGKPVFNVDDPLNLFLVVEQDNHHVTLLGGDKFEPLHRFKSRFALRGGAVNSTTGRYVYFVSQNGWVTKYDIYNLKMVAEIRVGINTRNLAVSADGRYVMAANYLPHTLVLLDALDLSPIKLYDVKNLKGKTSRVSKVYTAPPSNSFIVALKDLPELWEISYEDDPPLGFGMWMHDYRTDSGENTAPEPFPVRKIKAKNYLEDFIFDQEYVSVVGISREGKVQVADTDIGRIIVDDLGLPGVPHPGGGTSWQYQGRTISALPNLKQGNISIIDMDTWKTIKRIKTLGPGFSICSHENAVYAWSDVFTGPNKGAVHIIDKTTLEVVKTLRPVAGKQTAFIQFSRSGRYVMLGIQDTNGTVIIYNTRTLKEVKRLSMGKPPTKDSVKETRHAGATCR